MRPSCTYVTPLNLRGIETPQQAARFVSVMKVKRCVEPFSVENNQTVKPDIWSSFHSFVSRKEGEVIDHALLLCSMLLGFGVDAYIACGTNAEGLHYWVFERQRRTAEVTKYYFWESATG
jgi:centrosomal protein CEP76